MSERNIPYEHISKFIYMIKRNFPENEKFYYILFSIKFLGLICSTQNVKSFEDDENIRFSLLRVKFYITNKQNHTHFIMIIVKKMLHLQLIIINFNKSINFFKII